MPTSSGNSSTAAPVPTMTTSATPRSGGTTLPGSRLPPTRSGSAEFAAADVVAGDGGACAASLFGPLVPQQNDTIAESSGLNELQVELGVGGPEERLAPPQHDR